MSDDDTPEFDSTAFNKFMRAAAKQSAQAVAEPRHGFAIDITAADLRQRFAAHAKLLQDAVDRALAMPTLEDVAAEREKSPEPVSESEASALRMRARPPRASIGYVEARIRFLIDYAASLSGSDATFRISDSQWEMLFEPSAVRYFSSTVS